jgi:hypothetical protein
VAHDYWYWTATTYRYTFQWLGGVQAPAGHPTSNLAVVINDLTVLTQSRAYTFSALAVEPTTDYCTSPSPLNDPNPAVAGPIVSDL